MGCCCCKCCCAGAPAEMRRIAELSFKPTGVKTIDENCGKIAKIYEKIAIESNNLYDLVEIIADKSGTTTMAKKKIMASLQKQYEEWSKLLKDKSVKSALQDLPSLALGKITDLTNNLDSTISATLEVTKVFPRLASKNKQFMTMQKVIQHLEKMGDTLVQDLLCAVTSAMSLMQTMQHPEQAEAKAGKMAQKLKEEVAEVAHSGHAMSSTKAFWENMKKMGAFKKAAVILVNNIRVLVLAIMEAFSKKSPKAAPKLDEKKSKALKETVTQIHQKSQHLETMASAEEMIPYTLTPAELKKLGEWIDHKLEEMSLPDAEDLEWGCDFCFCDLEPDKRFYGCKKCMDGGDGESCDFYVCAECANMLVSYINKEQVFTAKVVQEVSKKYGHKYYKKVFTWITPPITCNVCNQAMEEGGTFLHSKKDHDVCGRCVRKIAGLPEPAETFADVLVEMDEDD